MKQLKSTIFEAQKILSNMLIELYQKAGRIEIDPYIRFLSMQYHLTKNVQKDMFSVAASPILANKKPLRDFLYRFGLEEESHYQLALNDLKCLGYSPLPIPLDVKLWKGYFSNICIDEPYIRLGATCVLETIAYGLSELILKILNESDKEIVSASKFLRIHLHTDDNMNHGEQVLECIKNSNLSFGDLEKLNKGAEEAKTVYLRMIYWVINGNCLLSEPNSFGVSKNTLTAIS